ncbi:hypothetical protein GCM10027422_03790 [Hymenobacter arcticus]
MQDASSLLVLLRNAAGQVLADPAGFLRLNWGNQPRPFAQTQAMFTTAAQALEERGWSRILINQVSMIPFNSKEQDWISAEWLPAAVQQSGYRFGAIVVASNVLTRLATSYITTSVLALPVRYRSFDSETAAVNWLLLQPK